MLENHGEHPFGHTGQFISLFVFLTVWITDSFIVRASTFLSAEVSLIIRLSCLGVILILAFFLSQSGHQVVPHKKQNEDLMTTGAFHYVRHPLYLSGLLLYLGLSVSTASLLSTAVFVGIFIFYDYIASYEEKQLEIKNGQAYLQYKQKTGKWLPRIGWAG